MALLLLTGRWALTRRRTVPVHFHEGKQLQRFHAPRAPAATAVGCVRVATGGGTMGQRTQGGRRGGTPVAGAPAVVLQR